MQTQKKQLLALIVIGIIILGVVAFMFKDSLLPKAIGGGLLPTSKHVIIPESEDYQVLFDRPEYKALQRSADVPVRPLGTNGNRDPFASPERSAEE
jgi:hypothetical protein